MSIRKICSATPVSLPFKPRIDAVPCVSLREETLFFALRCPLLQIKAGAKSSVTRTGENTDPDLMITSHLFTDVNNFPSHLLIDRVHNLRTIQCDVTNMVLYIVDNGLIVHDEFSFFRQDSIKDFAKSTRNPGDSLPHFRPGRSDLVSH